MATIKGDKSTLLLRPMRKQISIIIVFILLLSIRGNTQKGIEVGGWVGTSNYFGDLQTSLSFARPNLAGGVLFRYNFDERISAKSSFNYARISADDNNSINSFEFSRQLSFYSDIFELSTQLEFYFFPYVHGSDDENYTPYLFGGITALSFTPKREFDGRVFDLRLNGTEGQAIGEEYGKFTLAGLVGVGFKWDINYDWSFNIEAGLRVAASDFLDDVSTSFPDFNVLRQNRGQTAVLLSDPTNNPLNQGRQRGNNRNNDSYVLVGLSLVRYFGRLECPKPSQSR